MKRLTSGALALALMVLLAACSGADDETDTGTDTDTPTETEGSGGDLAITISDFVFSGPDTAAVGDTITVTNEDAVPHTWTAVDDAFDSGSLGQGESFDFTFDEAGEFDYFCAIHPTMTATITVEG